MHNSLQVDLSNPQVGHPHIKDMKNTLALCLFLSLTTCGAPGEFTAQYGIILEGDIAHINPSDVDRAWEMAASAAGMNGEKALAGRPVQVKFVDHVIPCPVDGLPDRICSGLTWIDHTQVWRPAPSYCVLGAESSLIHEFFHMVLGAANGDEDTDHKDPRWHEVNMLGGSCSESN